MQLKQLTASTAQITAGNNYNTKSAIRWHMMTNIKHPT